MASDRRHTTKNQGWSQSSQKQSHRQQFGSILSLSLSFISFQTSYNFLCHVAARIAHSIRLPKSQLW